MRFDGIKVAKESVWQQISVRNIGNKLNGLLNACKKIAPGAIAVEHVSYRAGDVELRVAQADFCFPAGAGASLYQVAERQYLILVSVFNQDAEVSADQYC